MRRKAASAFFFYQPSRKLFVTSRMELPDELRRTFCLATAQGH